jgi:orotate phosphoribosyltransferase-like protein
MVKPRESGAGVDGDIAVVGLGHVGLPVAAALAEQLACALAMTQPARSMMTTGVMRACRQ